VVVVGERWDLDRLRMLESGFAFESTSDLLLMYWL